MVLGVWGDSIAFGSCDQEALGWVGRLRKSLPIDDDHLLYNFSVCGDTSGDLLKRFETEARAIEPDKIIFAIGINDSKIPFASEGNLVPIDDFRKHIQKLLTQARHYSNEITLIGLTKVDDGWRLVLGERFLNEEIEKYDTAIKELAVKNGYAYIPVFDTLHPLTDLADGLHPNAVGYQKMFEVIVNKLT